MEIRLPPDQEAYLSALVAGSDRSIDDVVSEALALWRQRQIRRPVQALRTPAVAAARILEMREGNRLPEGETIKDLIEHGRA